MTKLLIILILIIFYLIFRGEFFTCSNYVKTPWAFYSSLDGNYLNYTTREEIPWVEYNLNDGVVEIWGYRGAGNPEVDDITFGGSYITENWQLLLRAYSGQKKVYFDKYKAYHIHIRF